MTTQLNPGAGPSTGGSAREWRDKKRHLWMLGLIIPTMLFLVLPVVWGLNQLGWHTASQMVFFIGPFLFYLVLPAADMGLGTDGQNPPEALMQKLELDKYYQQRRVNAYIPFQYASVILGAYLFTASDLSWLGYPGPLGWLGKIGIALSVGIVGGVAINTAHELGHKRDSLERWLSKIALNRCVTGTFYIEHNRGHHVRVATPEDPASAGFGESFWAFLPRTVIGSAKSALQLEATRIRRTGKSPAIPRRGWATTSSTLC